MKITFILFRHEMTGVLVQLKNLLVREENKRRSKDKDKERKKNKRVEMLNKLLDNEKSSDSSA